MSASREAPLFNMPAGRKRRSNVNALKAQNAPDENVIAAVVTEITSKELEKMRTALFDLAFGHKVRMRCRKRGSKVDEENEAEVTDEFNRHWWVYERPPDREALKLLLEHNIGRPAAKEAIRVDPVINLWHHVPGHRDIGTKPEGKEEEGPPPSVEEPEPMAEDLLDELFDGESADELIEEAIV